MRRKDCICFHANPTVSHCIPSHCIPLLSLHFFKEDICLREILMWMNLSPENTSGKVFVYFFARHVSLFVCMAVVLQNKDLK